MTASALKKVQVFCGKQGFEQLKPAWLTLATTAGTHFLHFPGWYEAQLANLDSAAHVFFVALYRTDDSLFAVLPFERSFFVKGALKVPVLQLFYPNEMGVNDVAAAEDLLPFRGAILRQLRKDVPYFTLVRWQCALAGGRAVSIIAEQQDLRVTHYSKYLDFSQGLDAFWAGYSSKFRKGLQKKMRKAEEQGSLRLVCATGGEQLQQAFEGFLEVENSGWKGEKGTSIAKQPAKLAYYRSLLASYGELGICQINLLYLDDTAIAAQFGVRINKRLFLLKIGFREEFGALSPGYLILGKLIEHGFATGDVQSVSFVTGVNWIDRWHPKAEGVGIFYTSNGTLPSHLMVKALLTAVKVKNRRAAAATETPAGDDED